MVNLSLATVLLRLSKHLTFTFVYKLFQLKLTQTKNIDTIKLKENKNYLLVNFNLIFSEFHSNYNRFVMGIFTHPSQNTNSTNSLLIYRHRTCAIF